MTVKFPHGKAPLRLFVIAISSLALSLVTRRRKEARPDLVMVSSIGSYQLFELPLTSGVVKG